MADCESHQTSPRQRSWLLWVQTSSRSIAQIRIWPAGEPWRQLVERIHQELNLPVMADIATLEEARAAAAAGADMIGTTLHGYTEQTKNTLSFSWSLLADIIRETGRPVVAEGHISTPEDARRAIMAGAWCVVVGSAITRPGTITSEFVHAVQRSRKSGSVIGVDIGGTWIKAGLVDEEGCIRFPTRIPTGARGGREAIAAATAEAIDQVLQSARQHNVDPVGLGIASAGVIEVSSGTVFAATENLPGWTGFELRAFAEQRFQIPTCVENDAHAAVLADMHFGSAKAFAKLCRNHDWHRDWRRRRDRSQAGARPTRFCRLVRAYDDSTKWAARAPVGGQDALKRMFPRQHWFANSGIDPRVTRKARLFRMPIWR